MKDREKQALIPRRRFLAESGRALLALALGQAGIVSCGNVPLFCQSGSAGFSRPARMWKKLPGNEVSCVLCPNGCRLADGDRGVCRVRQNIRGTLHTLVYSRIAAAHLDPVEKKPFFHFMPGSLAYSVATAGCNISCRFCQNWELSQSGPEEVEAVSIPPDVLPVRARSEGARIVAYTYNEPIVQFEYVVDSSLAAKRKGLRPVIVSNGHVTPRAAAELFRNLDAVKIDLKAFSQKFYRDICGGSLKSVMGTMELAAASGKWMEIVVLVIPTLNDSPEEITKMCSWIRRLSPDIPVHFSRFRAMYKIQNLPPTPISTLERCRTIARDQGVRYAYVGNVPGHPWENTWCHGCGKEVIRRTGFFHVESRLKNGACPNCGARVPGVWS